MDGSGVGVAVGIEVADGSGVGSSVGVGVEVAAGVSVAAGVVLVGTIVLDGSAGGAGVCGLQALNTMPSTTIKVNQGEPFTTVFAFILSIEITFNDEMAMAAAGVATLVMMIVERMIAREKTRLMYPGTPD